MCKYCDERESLLNDNGWEVYVDFYNQLQIEDKKGDRTTYIEIKYCPICGKKLK